MIGVIDYGMGNILSVQNALLFIGKDVQLVSSPAEILSADSLVLPGVGAFADGMRHLEVLGLIHPLRDAVERNGTPILGFCLGMQLMANRSFEGGEHKGLGWIDADVIHLANMSDLRVPHVGWDNISTRQNCPLFDGLPASPDVYFDHSFHIQCNDQEDEIAWCEYGLKFCAAIQHDNITATQFHPEKSQDIGLHILENYTRYLTC